MDYKAYEWRIAFSLVVLLILIQLAGFFSMLQSNRAIAISAVEVELQTASQVVTRLLKLRQQQLAQSTAMACGRRYQAVIGPLSSRCSIITANASAPI